LKSSDKEDLENMLALTGMENLIDWKGISSSIASNSPTIEPPEFSPSDIESVASNQAHPLKSHEEDEPETPNTIKQKKKSTSSVVSGSNEPTYMQYVNVPNSVILSVPGDVSANQERAAKFLSSQGKGSSAPVEDATLSFPPSNLASTLTSSKRGGKMSDNDEDSVLSTDSVEARAKARSERKQARKKVKRQEINVKIEKLTSTLMKIENQDNNGDFNPPANRVELMARTIVLLNNMHVENRKRRREIQFLKTKRAEVRSLSYAVATMERNNRARSLAQTRMNARMKPHDPYLRRDSLGFPMQTLNPANADFTSPYIQQREQLYTPDNMLGQQMTGMTPQGMQMQLQMQMKLQMQMQQLNSNTFPNQYYTQQNQASSMDTNFSAFMPNAGFNSTPGMSQDAFGLTANPSVSQTTSFMGQNPRFHSHQLAKVDQTQSPSKRRKFDVPFKDL